MTHHHLGVLPKRGSLEYFQSYALSIHYPCTSIDCSLSSAQESLIRLRNPLQTEFPKAVKRFNEKPSCLWR